MSYYESGFDENYHPYSVSWDGDKKIYDRELITNLEPWEQELVLDWVTKSFLPTNTICSDSTSYGLKHILQRELGIYLTNNQFKDAMQTCGFYPVDARELNWRYKISRKSPAFLYGECRTRNRSSDQLNIYRLVEEMKKTSKHYSDEDKICLIHEDGSRERIKK